MENRTIPRSLAVLISMVPAVLCRAVRAMLEHPRPRYGEALKARVDEAHLTHGETTTPAAIALGHRHSFPILNRRGKPLR
jgi:hypothetical protein